MKENFSIPANELDNARAMLESMAKDLAANLPIPKKGNPVSTGAATQGQQGPQPVPLSATNLEKQTQALSKAHNRSNSKSGQAPAAPTSAQPPSQPGAQISPTGHPMYLGKPAVTQENLQIPTSRKKAKTAHQQAGASPQVKPPSPEVKRQQHPEPKAPQAPPRAVIMCPEADCEMRTTGFANQDALNAHMQEEHIKPNEDPVKFVQESLALALGLDSQGRSKAAPAKAHAQDGSQLAAPPMASSQSKQGQTPMNNKLNPASTPMSREASMKRQGSNTGAKGAAENKATPGKSLPVKAGSTPRPTDSKLAATKPEFEPVHGHMAQDPFVGTTVDPQDLSSAGFFEVAARGLISDLNVYRSLTPNDTPESSKDSGASEPNSDISEGANIDIDMNWQTIEPDLLYDIGNFSMEGLEGSDTDILRSMEMDPSMQAPMWEDINPDFSKPFHFDSSLYSLDTM